MNNSILVMQTILIIDDKPTNLDILNELLKRHYRLLLVTDPQKSIEIASRYAPDLILLDIMMPSIDGFDVCRLLKTNSNTANIPIIFLTARVDPEAEEKGFELGAADFIHKPFTPSLVLARIKNHLQIKSWQEFIENKNSWLEQEVHRRTNQIIKIHDSVLDVMIMMAEFRDEDTGNHILRTREYVTVLANWIASNSSIGNSLSQETIQQIGMAAPLHDIGKITIPDNILLKPGKLDIDEFKTMQTHTTRGDEILRRAQDRVGEESQWLYIARQIARHHHERWDGSGYPDRLAGNEIPLAARLMSIADVYDALRCIRPYKSPLRHEEVVKMIIAGRDSHFDPKLVDAFLATHSEFEKISHRLADTAFV